LRQTRWFLLSLLTSVSCGRQDAAPVVSAWSDEAPHAQLGPEVQAAIARPAPPAEATACPAGMVLVEGEYCPNVELNCKRYLDGEGRYEKFRCAEYGPSTCRSKQRRHMKFCIDPHEYVPDGSSLPENFKSFTHAEKICGGLGKRICRESEWNFACEGEDMRPYPYGFKRDAGACNADRSDLFGASGKLRDLRSPPGAYPRCASPFGVFDMAGNLEEFVAIDARGPARPAMKGAYWQPGRNHCRAAQTAHDRYYNGTETGFRCCADTR
jgi:formylglycine-generating enzyme required for sulfatase activity